MLHARNLGEALLLWRCMYICICVHTWCAEKLNLYVLHGSRQNETTRNDVVLNRYASLVTIMVTVLEIHRLLVLISKLTTPPPSSPQPPSPVPLSPSPVPPPRHHCLLVLISKLTTPPPPSSPQPPVPLSPAPSPPVPPPHHHRLLVLISNLTTLSGFDMFSF